VIPYLEIMIIHPAIWKQVSKMYRWQYKKDFEIQKIFQLLNIDNMEVAKLSNLEEFLNNLRYEQSLDVIKDVLQTDDFWPTENDLIRRRNSYKKRQFEAILPNILSTQSLEPSIPEQRLFGEELSNLLKNLCGIIYNRYERTLSIQEAQGILEVHKTINTHLLISVEFEEYFFKIINQELNGVFRAGFYNSTLLLARKLTENLLIILLLHKYPKEKSDKFQLYFDESQNRYRDFSKLIRVFRENKADFNDGYSPIQRTLSKLENLTKITNPAAHDLMYNAVQSDVNSLDLQEIIELFRKIYQNESLTSIFKK
jgi:hypothetical protein